MHAKSASATPVRPCENCNEARAELYCVECSQSFCRFCAVLLHHPSTKKDRHSIEVIAVVAYSRVIAQMLDEALIVGMSVFLVRGIETPEQYFSGASYCPTLNKVRAWMQWWDISVLHILKGHLQQYCDWEDSYSRYFLDTWYRAILTGTDSQTYMLQQFISAAIMTGMFQFLVLPITFCYACIAATARHMETSLQSCMPDGHQWAAHMKTASTWIENHGVARLFMTREIDPTPPTFWRKRPPSDDIDRILYIVSRWTRLFRSYHRRAANCCQAFLQKLLLYSIVIRVVFYSASRIFGISGIVDLFPHFADLCGLMDSAKPFMPRTKGKHRHDGHMTDFIWGGIWTGIQQGIQNFLYDMFTGWSLVLLVLLLAACFPCISFMQRIAHQKEEFERSWRLETCQRVWGHMSRENPCGDWDSMSWDPIF
mmetsp:Transcript_43969/g.80568  ORF Transcript_43969/g.80568 Transcript_43969/m.80568 type:complete len:426 (-) Transcript_43969:18-1295(-)